MDRMLLKPEEIRDITGIGLNNVYRMIHLKLIPSIKVGRTYRVHRDVLNQSLKTLNLKEG